MENAFVFESYNDDELLLALEWKLKSHDLTATDAAKATAIEVLGRLRNRPNFGNIGEVENMLNLAKLRIQKRQAALPIELRSVDAPLEPVDFDPDFDRSKDAAANLQKLFEDVIGCEETVAKLDQYQRMAQTAKDRGLDPRQYVPTNFVFKGPPGVSESTPCIASNLTMRRYRKDHNGSEDGAGLLRYGIFVLD